MGEWLYFFIGLAVGLLIGMVIGGYIKFITTESESVDKEAIKKATSELDKGSTDLKQEVDKHHL